MKMKKVLVSLLVGVGLMVGLSSQAQAVPEEFIHQPFTIEIDNFLNLTNAANPFGISTGDQFFNNSATYDRNLLLGGGSFETPVTGSDLNEFRFDFGSFSLLGSNGIGVTFGAEPNMIFDDTDGDGIAELVDFDFRAEFDFLVGTETFRFAYESPGFVSDFSIVALSDGILSDGTDLGWDFNDTVVSGFYDLPDDGFDPFDPNVPVIPEPSTIILLGMGLGGLAVLRQRQKKA